MKPLNNDSSICPSQAAIQAELDHLKKEQKKDEVALEELIRDTLLIETKLLTAIRLLIETAKITFSQNKEKFAKANYRLNEIEDRFSVFQRSAEDSITTLRATIITPLQFAPPTPSKPGRKRYREEVAENEINEPALNIDDRVQAAQTICSMKKIS